jgi:trimeric autotransporter adhesin
MMDHVYKNLFLSNYHTTGIISTVAGNGDYFITTGLTGDGGQATLATLGYPKGVAVDASGNIYIADTLNNRIRMVTKSTGIINTVAGSGQSGSSPGKSGYSGDGGQATSATLSNPDGVALDASGNIYIADTANNRIRMVTKSTGIISTVAGKGGFYGYSGDGRQATTAALAYPSGVTIDASGNIYIADTNNNCIRMVTKSTGIISTVAGKGEKYGYSGDGGQATLADFHFPHSVAVDASGNIYIADSRNDRIRMVTKSTGIITTVVGTEQSGFIGDEGPATSATLSFPYGVVLDASGNIYIADSNNNLIRMVTKSTGIISTIAGSGVGTYGGDGEQATSASVYSPYGVAVDTSGTLYIADSANNRIRIIGESAPPSVPISPSSPTPSPFPSSPLTSPSPSSPVTPASPSSPSAALVASACAGTLVKLVL